MMLATLCELYERDLRRLEAEINAYADEDKIWVVQGEITNAAGNLCLHLIGNLNHFIGAVLGNTGYVRDRENEFAATGIPRDTLITCLNETRHVVQTTLEQLTDTDLQQNYPIDKHGQVVTMPYMLLHLLTHLNYHLGQVNYHRRLVG